MRDTGYASGLAGEEQALRYLTGRGMTLVERRYRGGDGEIDLVMAEGETLVFAEVKYRPSGRAGDGLSAVTPGKRRRLAHAAEAYLYERDVSDRPVRFDVVEITRDGVLHIPDAFRADPTRE